MPNYYRDEPCDSITDSESFKFKTCITGSTPNDNDKNEVEIAAPIKYLRNFLENS